MDNTDNIKKYQKIRKILESASFLIALIVGQIISSSLLGIYGSKFFSLDTALSLAIVLIIAAVLDYISVQIADSWYKKASNKK